MSYKTGLREKLADGRFVLGTHVSAGHPMITEILGKAGFDAIWIDTEHTAIDKSTLLLNIIAAQGAGAAAVVRIPWNDPVLAKPVLEMGVDGIVFPYVRNASEAKLAVSSCLYPPEGIRGFGPIRATEYGNTDTMDYINNKSKNVLKIIQVEHIDAVDNLDDILAIPHMDAIVIGPNDFSGSLGLLGQPMHPDVKKYFPVIAEKCKQAGKPFGVSTGYDPNNTEGTKYWLELGADFMFLGGDTAYVMNGARLTINGVIELKGVS